VVVWSAALAALAPAPLSNAATVPTVPDARSFGGLPAVGALFTGPSDSGLHFCTASVVHSPGHDLLITAAHCLSGTGRGLYFAPMFHDGTAPFGMWEVVAAYAGRRWVHDRDPRDDVAFLAVAPRIRAGKRTELEDVVGANRLVVSTGFRARATLVGYPIGSGGRPITCSNEVYDHLGYPGFDCGGYVGGTSGGPWITHLDRRTRSGDVAGVIGGLHQGGCTPSISYSPYFDASTAAVYQQAVRHGHGDTLPSAGSDGC
jgi:V8-like Glu-specific endopeptidase